MDIITDPTVSEVKLPIFKVYTALLTQSGTDAPVATILENTLGDVVWTRNEVGNYRGTLTGAFTVGKTVIAPFTQSSFQVIPISKVGWLDYGYTMDSPTADQVRLFTVMGPDTTNVEMNEAVGTHTILVDIRVYP